MKKYKGECQKKFSKVVLYMCVVIGVFLLCCITSIFLNKNTLTYIQYQKLISEGGISA